MARQPGQSCTGGPDCQSLGAEGRAGFARLGGLAGRGRAGGFGFRILERKERGSGAGERAL